MIPGRDVVCRSCELYSCPAAKLGFEYRESRIWMLDLFPVQVGIGEHVTRVLYLRVYHQAIKPAGIVDGNGPVQIFSCSERALGQQDRNLFLLAQSSKNSKETDLN